VAKKGIIGISDSMGAMLFGVLMTMVTISSLTIVGEEAEILGFAIAVTAIAINLGHGIVHGSLYIFERGFEKGKRWKYVFDVKALGGKNEVIARLEEDIGNSSFGELSARLRKEIALELYEKLKGVDRPPMLRPRREDILGAFYKGFLVFVVGLPVILPLLFIPNLDTATLVSGVIAI